MPNVIKVNTTTELRLQAVNNGVAKFNEVYQGWETGNTVETPEKANYDEVVAIYRATVKS